MSSDTEGLPDGDLSWEQIVLSLGDMRLRFPDGRKLSVNAGMLRVASPALRSAIQLQEQQGASKQQGEVKKAERGKRRRSKEEQECLELQVDDSFEAWEGVLRMLYQALSPVAFKPSPAMLFAMMRVLHKYNMAGLLQSAFLEVKRECISNCCSCFGDGLGFAEGAKPDECGATDGPRLLQWLLLGSELQYQPLVQASLYRLRQLWTDNVWPRALCWTGVRRMLRQLRPEVLSDFMELAAGISPRFNDLAAPDLSKAPRICCPMETEVVCLRHGCIDRSAVLVSVLQENSPRNESWGAVRMFVRRGTDGALQADDYRHLEYPGHGVVAGLASCHSSDGSQHVAVSADVSHSLYLWNLLVEEGAAGVVLRKSAHEDHVMCLKFFEEGNKLLSASEDKSVKVWDVATLSLAATLAGHDGAVMSVATAAHDDSIAVSGSKDNTLRLWDLRTSSCVRTMAGHTDVVRAVALTSGGSTATTGSWDGSLKTWDVGSGRCLSTIQGPSGHSIARMVVDEATTAALTLGWSKAAAGSDAVVWDTHVKTWDLAKGTCEASHTLTNDSGSRADPADLTASSDLKSVLVLWQDSGRRQGFTVW